ncbi:MAG: hypothetical protein MZV63_27295, partial [Marinilabiliales bacterium]|nr:hypothetical protein [Marinilabiliales bacterium]
TSFSYVLLRLTQKTPTTFFNTSWSMTSPTANFQTTWSWHALDYVIELRDQGGAKIAAPGPARKP